VENNKSNNENYYYILLEVSIFYSIVDIFTIIMKFIPISIHPGKCCYRKENVNGSLPIREIYVQETKKIRR